MCQRWLRARRAKYLLLGPVARDTSSSPTPLNPPPFSCAPFARVCPSVLYSNTWLEQLDPSILCFSLHAQLLPPSSSSMSSSDNYFGPQLPHIFDFTILFEQSILSILPTSLFIVLAPIRLWSLHRHETRVASRRLLWSKLVTILFL
jgi:hypothetical protein